ncbi:MAG: hydrogenase maturation nickel metallochaperone HypA [Syntrophorhabdaceae bacterium]|nr:hydrogenase maturation nickel metallochaperone HypA [Syntrophorhabdaceae bacterium]
MHELTITENMVGLVTEEAKGRKVSTINLVIGELSGVVEESLIFCFHVISKGTLLEGASLNIKKIEGRMRCRLCSFEFGIDGDGLCPACRRPGGKLISGKELYIESIEVEDRDEDRGG